jgi:ABC-type branched-subunit amino acid transport system substrate-binding protein
MFAIRKYYWLVAALVAVVALAMVGCAGEPQVREVPVTVEVAKEIVVEKAVVKEVPVTVQVEKDVVREVPVTVQVEREITRDVPVTVQVEVEKEVIRDVPVTVQVPMEALDPLIVGNLNVFTGSLSEFGPPLRNSIELAADHVNRAGGVGGASMVIISRDTAVNPVQGVDGAKGLVDVENVVAIVGALSSGVTIAVAQSVTVPQETLMISGASTAPSITVLEDNDFLFRTTPSDASQGVVLARLAEEQGYETVGIMYINNAYGEGLADQFEKSFTALGGEVTARVPHEDVQPTYVSELDKATEGDPDVLAVLSYTGQASVYVREALEGDYADKFLFADGTKGAEWIEGIDVWDALDGSLGTAQGSEGSPAKDAFENGYTDSYGVPPSHPFMAEHYDATVLVALAAAKAGSTTDSAAIRDSLRFVANAPGEMVGPGRDEIAKALALIADGKDINYNGAGGDIEFDENGDVFGTIEIWQIKDGEISSTGRFELP